MRLDKKLHYFTVQYHWPSQQMPILSMETSKYIEYLHQSLTMQL